MNGTAGASSNGGRRRMTRDAAAFLFALALPGAVAAQEIPTPGTEAQLDTTSPGTLEQPRTPVTQGQAESAADTLGVDRLLETDEGDVPVTQGQAESNADALGGVDEEGALDLGQQPGQAPGDVARQQRELGFGEQGVLDLGQQPRTGGTEPGAEGQDLLDADLGARGVDVEGERVETIFPDANRAARGVEPTEPGGIEQPLEDVDLQARGVRLQGEQVNEELLDVRAGASRGVELSEGQRAAPREIPARNVPGGGVIVVPGTGVIVVEGTGVGAGVGPAVGGGVAAQQVPGEVATTTPEGIEPVGEGAAPAGSGVLAAASTELEEAEELERVSVTGTVLDVSYSDAIAAVSTDEEGVIALRARPQEIALLQPGDFVSLDVVEVGDAIWIAPAARFEPASADVTAAPGTGALSRDLGSPIFEQRGRAEGVVTAVNENEGLFLVGDTQYQAHPLQVQDLEPGQMVSLSYGTVDGEAWAAEIRVGGTP